MEQLKKIYFDKGIISCELNYPGCFRDNFLGFAHLHKRNWYKNQQEILMTFEQTILACNHCHDIIEKDSKLTAKEFGRLRDEDRLKALEY